MLDLRRDYLQKNAESRENPRIELHLPVTIIGLDADAGIIDFSLGGFYIETEAVTRLKNGRKVNIALKLPSEPNLITAKIEVVYCTRNGFGCKLCDPGPEVRRALRICFDMFSETLPVALASYEQYRPSVAA